MRLWLLLIWEQFGLESSKSLLCETSNCSIWRQVEWIKNSTELRPGNSSRIQNSVYDLGGVTDIDGTVCSSRAAISLLSLQCMQAQKCGKAEVWRAYSGWQCVGLGSYTQYKQLPAAKLMQWQWQSKDVNHQPFALKLGPALCLAKEASREEVAMGSRFVASMVEWMAEGLKGPPRPPCFQRQKGHILWEWQGHAHTIRMTDFVLGGPSEFWSVDPLNRYFRCDAPVRLWAGWIQKLFPVRFEEVTCATTRCNGKQAYSLMCLNGMSLVNAVWKSLLPCKSALMQITFNCFFLPMFLISYGLFQAHVSFQSARHLSEFKSNWFPKFKRQISSSKNCIQKSDEKRVRRENQNISTMRFSILFIFLLSFKISPSSKIGCCNGRSSLGLRGCGFTPCNLCNW